MATDANERNAELIGALRVLIGADAGDIKAALDGIETTLGKPLSVYARDRAHIAVRLLRAADDEVEFLAETLRLSCPPELRGAGR